MQNTLIQKTNCYKGKVRLRTPKGVGQYDFRYFIHDQPISKSSLLTVEVQGEKLIEALERLSKTVAEK